MFDERLGHVHVVAGRADHSAGLVQHSITDDQDRVHLTGGIDDAVAAAERLRVLDRTGDRAGDLTDITVTQESSQ
ncbi:hypothetical protein [Nocardia tengchongensis]|uniref:hypothetical protein n=2 Tax=Nocardia tengchongensis TaxID=2055889 RepID=UPI00369C7E2E